MCVLVKARCTLDYAVPMENYLHPKLKPFSFIGILGIHSDVLDLDHLDWLEICEHRVKQEVWRLLRFKSGRPFCVFVLTTVYRYLTQVNLL